MNNHLNADTDPAWRTAGQRASASRRRREPTAYPKRSWAHRCSFGCRGSGVLHTKMYLFDSTVPAPGAAANKIENTVFVGSSNMTSNAAKVQWNDLYGVRGNGEPARRLPRHVQPDGQGQDRPHLRVYSASGGKYVTTFWPQGTAADPEGRLLDSIKCSGATGGTGIGGHTLVYINMHAWFGTRGLGFANKVRGLYNRGCYVRVLYSFMSHAVYQEAAPRARPPGWWCAGRCSPRTAGPPSLYSHFKNIAVSGQRRPSNTVSRVVWTGSNNFTNDGTHFDEVMMRIADGAAYAQYVKPVELHQEQDVLVGLRELLRADRRWPRAGADQGVAASNALVSPDGSDDHLPGRGREERRAEGARLTR